MTDSNFVSCTTYSRRVEACNLILDEDENLQFTSFDDSSLSGYTFKDCGSGAGKQDALSLTVKGEGGGIYFYSTFLTTAAVIKTSVTINIPEQTRGSPIVTLILYLWPPLEIVRSDCYRVIVSFDTGDRPVSLRDLVYLQAASDDS